MVPMTSGRAEGVEVADDDGGESEVEGGGVLVAGPARCLLEGAGRGLPAGAQDEQRARRSARPAATSWRA